MLQLNFTKYDNNPQAKQRAVTLSILEPFVTKTVTEVKELGVDVVDLTIKTYFNDFIERFELENVNVVDFMSTSPYGVKIQAINAELIKYAEEKITAAGIMSVSAAQATVEEFFGVSPEQARRLLTNN